MIEKINIAIAGIKKFFPKREVGNLILERILDQYGVKTKRGEPITADWMEEHVGLNNRFWASLGEYSSDLGREAAKLALIDANISPYDLNVVRVGSSTPDTLYPGLSCLIQKGLVKEGDENLNLDAMDISSACTSGLHALIATQQAMLANEDYKYGLAVAAETMSKVVSFNDQNAQLWGDGAAAVVLEKTTEDRGIICSVFGSTPEASDKAVSVGLGVKYVNEKHVDSNAYLIGSEVQKFVLKTLLSLIPQTIEKANRIFSAQGKSPITLEDVKMFGLHQANGKIFDYPAKHLGIPREKFFVNFEKYGNISSASVLVVLAEMLEQKLVQAGDLILLAAFGGGLTWGSVLYRV